MKFKTIFFVLVAGSSVIEAESGGAPLQCVDNSHGHTNFAPAGHTTTTTSTISSQYVNIPQISSSQIPQLNTFSFSQPTISIPQNIQRPTAPSLTTAPSVQPKLINASGSAANTNIVNGFSNQVKGDFNFVNGNQNAAIGLSNLINGNTNDVKGILNKIEGNFNGVTGIGNGVQGGANQVNGVQNIVNGNFNALQGNQNVAEGNANLGVGDFNKLLGDWNFAIGSGNTAVGNVNKILGH